MPVDFVGPSATQANVDKVKNAIENTWSNKIGPYDVTTTVTTPDKNVPADKKNTISLDDQVSPSFVQDDRKGNWNGGSWNPNASKPEISHELPHLAGQPDRYAESVKNGVRTTTPMPGFEDDLMATLSGKPSKKTIDGIVEYAREKGWASEEDPSNSKNSDPGRGGESRPGAGEQAKNSDSVINNDRPND